MANTFQLQVDWSNDGDYSDTGEDVTARVFGDGVSVHRGRDVQQALAPFAPGVIDFGLGNTSGDYYPDNASSPLFGNIGPGRPIRFQCFDTAETSFQLDYPNLGQSVGALVTLASCPDTVPLSITGDIDLRMKITPDWWHDSEVAVRKSDTFFSSTTRSYDFGLTSDFGDGLLRLRTSPDGSALVSASSTVTVWEAGIKHGQTFWIRGTRDVDNGAGGNTTIFYTSPDGSAWTQLGASVVNSGTTSIADNTQTVKIVGGYCGGKIHTVQIYQGIAGTLRADPDFTDSAQWQAGDDAGDTGSDGVNTWTLAGESTIGVRPLFAGGLDEFATFPYPENSEPYVRLSGLGWLGRLRGVHVSTPVYQGVSLSSLIPILLEAAGVPERFWPSQGFDSSTVLPYWYADGDAYEELQKLVASEGPGAVIYEDGWGRIRFKGRNHQTTHYTSATSQATFDDATEPAFSDLVDDRGWGRVINDVVINVQERRRSDLGVVWRYDGMPDVLQFSTGFVSESPTGGPLVLSSLSGNPLVAATLPAGAIVFPAAGEVKTFQIVSDAPFVDAATPIAGVDFNYFGVGFTATAALSQTSGKRLTLTLTGSASSIGGWVTFLQLRASTLTTVGTVQATGEDAASKAIYGVRSYMLDAPWMDENTAKDMVAVILNDYKNPRPTVTLTFAAGNTETTRLSNMLERDVTERVTVTDTVTSWSADGHIQSVDHVVSDDGQTLDTVITVEKAVTPLVSASAIFILDSSTNAVLGTDLLAY